MVYLAHRRTLPLAMEMLPYLPPHIQHKAQSLAHKRCFKKVCWINNYSIKTTLLCFETTDFKWMTWKSLFAIHLFQKTTFKSSCLSFSVVFTVTSAILEASVAQGNSSSLQRQAHLWLISSPQPYLAAWSIQNCNFQAAVIEQILWLLKSCQLAHYRSHNSGKAQTRTTSWKKIYHSLSILRQLLPLLFQTCHCLRCQG